jgi:TonB family protein
VRALEETTSGIQKNEAVPTKPKSKAPDHEIVGRPDLSHESISAPAGATPQLQEPQPVVAESEEGVSDAEAPPAERAERRQLAFAQSENEDSKAKKADVNKEQEDVKPDKVDAKLDAGRSIASNSAEAELKAPYSEKATVDPKNVFTGKVVDDDGNGIPGVNVIVKGTNTGTVTDINGNYQLALDDAKPTLVYTFIGYTSTEEVADISKPSAVELDEDVTQLSEVVVAGYGAQREIDPLESTIELAYPVGGKRQYKQYLEKNLQYPQTALLNNVEGRVTVQFAVETTGSLADFKVLKGIGNGCDEEVIRLIKSGPKWTPTKRDDVAEKSVIKVRMRFQLPKKKK